MASPIMFSLTHGTITQLMHVAARRFGYPHANENSLNHLHKQGWIKRKDWRVTGLTARGRAVVKLIRALKLHTAKRPQPGPSSVYQDTKTRNLFK